MRKLFLASMLTLGMAGAAFANDNKTETTSEIIALKVEITVKAEKKTNKVKGCISYTLSCGKNGTLCDSNDPIGDVIKMDEALCKDDKKPGFEE